MKSLKYFFFVLFHFFILDYSLSQEITLTECGKTILAESGIIQYKLNQTYEANELCAFIVRYKGFANYTFRLEESGISSSEEDTITILSNNFGEIDTFHLGPEAGKEVTVNGWAAVVVFKIGQSQGTGFQLSFKAENEDEQLPVPGFDVVLSNATKSPLGVPFMANYTGEPQNSILVFTSGSKLVTEVDSFLKLYAIGVFGNKETCYNLFLVCRFDKDVEVLGTVCRDNREVLYQTKGLFIVYFQQGGNEPARGVLKWGEVSTSSGNRQIMSFKNGLLLLLTLYWFLNASNN